MKKTSIYFCLLFLLAKLTIAQQCTFENIYPYNASKYDLIYKTNNNDFICLTRDCVDTSANRSCAGGSFVNQILRIDSCGKLIWSRRVELQYGYNAISGISENESQDLILVGTNYYLSGLRILKLSKDGYLLYEKRLLNLPIPGSAIYFNPNTFINNITKLADHTFLIWGNLTSYALAGKYSKPFILKIDENGNILKFKTYTQNFKWNNTVNPSIPNTDLRFLSKSNDTTCYFVAQIWDNHIDTIISNLPANYWDLAVVFIDSNLEVKNYYNLTDLADENVLPHINRDNTFEEIRPVNDSVIFIMGESMFNDFKGPPPVNRLLRGSAFLSVNERKFISRKKYNLGESYLYPLLFKENLISLYNNPKEGGYILRDQNINIIKNIKTAIPQKFHIYPESPGFPLTNTLSSAYLTNDYSIIALGSSTFRKIKVSTEDSIFTRSEFAHEFYIIKIDSNGNFTPTTWNSINETKKNDLMFQFYPNPADNKIEFKIPYSFYNFKIYDIRGNIVKTFDYNQKEIQIETSSLEEGLYIIKVTDKTDGNTLIQKIIISRNNFR